MAASQFHLSPKQKRDKLIQDIYSKLGNRFKEYHQDFEKAVADIFDVGARVQKLELKGKNLRIIFIGDAATGKDSKSQKEVAEKLNKFIGEYKKKNPDEEIIIINLGDSFYKESSTYNPVDTDYLESPGDQKFTRQVDNIYKNPDLPHLCATPMIFIGGNHDCNLSAMEESFEMGRSFLRRYPALFGEEALLNVIARAYFTNEKDKAKYNEKAKFIYSQPSITMDDLRSLPIYMPFFHFGLDVGKLRLFFLDSNTLGKNFAHLEDELDNFETMGMSEDEIQNQKLSFLESLKDRNQSAWVIQIYQEAIKAGQTPVFIHHQPVGQIHSSRAYKHDAHMYMNGSLEIAQKKLPLNANDKNDYAKILGLYYDKWQLHPAKRFVAHAHAAWVEDKQIGTGNSGHDRHPRYYYGNQNITYVDEYGFNSWVVNTENPKENLLEVVTLGDTYLRFENDCDQPARIDKDEKVKNFREAIITNCKNYFKFCHERQKLNKGSFFGPLDAKNVAEQSIRVVSTVMSTVISSAASQVLNVFGYGKTSKTADTSSLTSFSIWSTAPCDDVIQKIQELLLKVTTKLEQQPNAELSEFNTQINELKKELSQNEKYFNSKEEQKEEEAKPAKGNMTHKIGDATQANHIINYLNHPHPDDHFTTLSKVLDMTKSLQNKTSTNSLYRNLMHTILTETMNQQSIQYLSLLSTGADSLKLLIDYTLQEIMIEKQKGTSSLYLKLTTALSVLHDCKYVPTHTVRAPTPALSQKVEDV